ncbi:MAG TPA: transposase [Polyangium sp.]|nr:transposase [Polyangium sp.]
MPKFLEMFHSLVSRGIKRIHAWDGAVWDRAQTSVIELCTRQAIIEKIAYTLANPVRAGLVWMAREWPGVKTTIKGIGRHFIEARRPQTYFSAQNDKWVPSAKLIMALPPSVPVDEVRGFRRAIGRELCRLENAAHAVIPKQVVLGAKKAMLIAPETRITSYEPKYQHHSTFAVGREAPPEARLAAVAKRRAFRVAYRNALLAWRAGNRTVEFPAGTYAMREFHRANIAHE